MLGDIHAQLVRKVSTMQLQKEHTARETVEERKRKNPAHGVFPWEDNPN